MKKTLSRITALVTAVALAFSLTGCANSDQKDESSGSSVQFSSGFTQEQNSTALLTDSSSQEQSDEWEQYRKEFEAERSGKMAAFPETINLPDGGTASKDEVIFPHFDELDDVNADAPYLEFAYIRCAEPIFITSFDAPEKFCSDNTALKEPIELQEFKWIKVKAGDILENGWTVASARSFCTYDGDIYNCELGFEGELSFDGILNYYNGGPMYSYGDYYLVFYPDSTKYKLPVAYRKDGVGSTDNKVSVNYLQGDEKIACDGGSFYFFRFKADFKDRLTENCSFKAAMTFRDLKISGDSYDGEIVRADF